MAFEKRYYVRKVRIVKEVEEVWASTANHKDYILKDGSLAFDRQLNKVEEVLEPFRILTDFEVSLLYGTEI